MQRLLGNILVIEGAVAVIAYVMTASLLLLDIIGREIFNSPVWGAQKLAVFGAIIAGILGLSMAVANNTHLRANFADKLLPFGWADRLGDFVSACIYGLLAWYAFEFVDESITYKDKAEVIHIPLWPFQLVFPYAFLMSSIRHLYFCARPHHKPNTTEAP